MSKCPRYLKVRIFGNVDGDLFLLQSKLFKNISISCTLTASSILLPYFCLFGTLDNNLHNFIWFYCCSETLAINNSIFYFIAQNYDVIKRNLDFKCIAAFGYHMANSAGML